MSELRATRRGALGACATAMLIAVASAQRVLAGEATPATGGDPRSPGEGPGLVGDPVFAIAAVLIVGVASLILTLAYVRLTDRRRGPDDRR